MKVFRTPALLKKLFPRILWNGLMNENQVCLTFDDGPDPVYTPPILEILGKEGVRATFFVLGQQAMRHPELIKQIHSAGHQLGLHGFEHERLFYQPLSYLSDQLERSKTIIEALIREPIQYFRPPFGTFSPRVLKICARLNLRIVLWSLMTYDFDIELPTQSIIHTVNRIIVAGDILVLHDGHRHSYRTVQMLQPMIQIIKDRGFKLALVAE